MIKRFELLAFAVSVAAFGYGAFYLFKKEIPKYYQLYVCATLCYMLEELWVVVNSLLGSGSRDGLVTVRLFGFFGCLCFMLSANVNEFDKVVDEGQNKRTKLSAFIAPAVLLAVFSIYAVLTADQLSAAAIVVGFISVSPALLVSYFCLKHLLLPIDTMGFLRITKGLNILVLVFCLANYVYPLIDLYCSKSVMSVYDLFLSGMIFAMVVTCRKEAEQWKTLI